MFQAHFLRALSSRNYRLYYGGQGLSVIGTWITRVATSWLVYRLTGSAFTILQTIAEPHMRGRVMSFYFTTSRTITISESGNRRHAAGSTI